MRPANTRVWRKNRRTALRGIPTGRRATHEVKTTPSRHYEAWERGLDAYRQRAVAAARGE